MNKVLFSGAFIAAGLPMALFLASKDAEPDMAGLSLLLFCLLSTVTSLLAYTVGSYKFHRIPSALHGLCAGVIAAALFFTVLSFISKTFDFWPCLLTAFFLSAVLAATSPLMGTKCLTPHSSGTPNGAP
jgi:uncharacterized membrane protein YoaK (UPF0700 family)